MRLGTVNKASHVYLVISWRFWLYLLVGIALAALLSPLALEGQEPEPLSHEAEVQFTDEERMSVKDKQAEYWRLQAQAASILLQAEKLQLDLSNEVRAMQARCQEGGGKFDPGMVSCTKIQAQSADGDGSK